MSKRNTDCILKYCQECKVRLHQGNCREEVDYMVLTRKCPSCGKSIHIIEVLKEEYENSVDALNKIIDFIAEKKG